MLRFSLATLLLLVLVAAVGCAAAVNPTGLWRQIVVTTTVGMLLLATLAAFFGKGGLRIFGGGFALTGWLYFALTFVAFFGLRDHLLTSRALEWIGTTIHSDWDSVTNVQLVPNPGMFIVPSVDSSRSWTSPVRIWDVNSERTNFHNIGHALWIIIVGCVGGITAGWLHGKPRGHPAVDE